MTLNNISRAAIIIVSVGALSSCHIYNKFSMPTDDTLTSQYVEAVNSETNEAAFGNMKWQDVFTDPILAGLIDQALVNNTNLNNAKLNVDIAHAQLKGARLSYLPSLTLMPNASAASYDHSHMNWTYQIPLAVSWEIDIFGKLLNSNRRAKAALLQSEAYEQAVRSQIIAGVANCYYSISMLEKQLEISRQTAEYWSESVQVMKNLKLAGRVNESAVVQSTANYYSILASITDLEVALHEANNSMSLLMNVPPQTWEIPSGAEFNTPAIVREGVPMRELASRPDVRAAEQNVAMAYYATNQARAAFYPGLTISSNGGFTNLLGSVISNPGKWFIQLAGQLTAPIFARGQLISNLEATRAQQQQAMNNFQYALLSASAEVSEALMLYNKSDEKAKLLAQQVENLQKSVEITEELLSLNGSSTYLEVLTAQQSLLSAQIAQVTCLNAKARAGINLYQSLGGGR